MRLLFISFVLIIQHAYSMSCLPTASREFSGYQWLFSHRQGGPGPNHFLAENVFIDECDRLHLNIKKIDSVWTTSEAVSVESFGFGLYEFNLESLPIFDPSSVLGLFNYPPNLRDPDGTNEIDIEVSQWGDKLALRGQFGVYPASKSLQGKPTQKKFPILYSRGNVKLSFKWESDRVDFQYFNVDGESFNWSFAPLNPKILIPQRSQPVFLNLWLFRGKKSERSLNEEVIINSFVFTPEVR